MDYREKAKAAHAHTIASAPRIGNEELMAWHDAAAKQLICRHKKLRRTDTVDEKYELYPFQLGETMRQQSHVGGKFLNFDSSFAELASSARTN